MALISLHKCAFLQVTEDTNNSNNNNVSNSQKEQVVQDVMTDTDHTLYKLDEHGAVWV